MKTSRSYSRIWMATVCLAVALLSSQCKKSPETLESHSSGSMSLLVNFPEKNSDDKIDAVLVIPEASLRAACGNAFEMVQIAKSVSEIDFLRTQCSQAQQEANLKLIEWSDLSGAVLPPSIVTRIKETTFKGIQRISTGNVLSEEQATLLASLEKKRTQMINGMKQLQESNGVGSLPEDIQLARFWMSQELAGISLGLSQGESWSSGKGTSIKFDELAEGKLISNSQYVIGIDPSQGNFIFANTFGGQIFCDFLPIGSQDSVLLQQGISEACNTMLDRSFMVIIDAATNSSNKQPEIVGIIDAQRLKYQSALKKLGDYMSRGDQMADELRKASSLSNDLRSIETEVISVRKEVESLESEIRIRETKLDSKQPPAKQVKP